MNVGANDFDIIIPVYNEAENIEHCLLEIKKNIGGRFKVVIVYDLEDDNTIPVINKIKNTFDFPVNLIKNNFGRGPANAIKTGFMHSESKAVLVVMGDISDDLKSVNSMYVKIKGGYDVVCGSRYMKGGKQIGGPFIKGIMSRIASLSLYFLAGLPTHDATNSFKMYNKDLLDNITIESKRGFEVGIEIVAKAFIEGYKIIEVPCVWNNRTAGSSNFKIIKWMPDYLKWYFRIFKYGILKIK
jgi:glycosyltransferase involved in cell wall biosynthesis